MWNRKESEIQSWICGCAQETFLSAQNCDKSWSRHFLQPFIVHSNINSPECGQVSVYAESCPHCSAAVQEFNEDSFISWLSLTRATNTDQTFLSTSTDSNLRWWSAKLAKQCFFHLRGMTPWSNDVGSWKNNSCSSFLLQACCLIQFYKYTLFQIVTGKLKCFSILIFIHLGNKKKETKEKKKSSPKTIMALTGLWT